MVCPRTFIAISRAAFSLVWPYQAVRNHDSMDAISWCCHHKSQFCSPLTEGRGTSRERDKKRVILSWPSCPAGFSVWPHKHLCPQEAGRVGEGCDKWFGMGEDENVSFADTAGLNWLRNCGPSTSLVCRHSSGSRNPRPPLYWSRFFGSSSQKSLSYNNPAQNRHLFFAASTFFQHCN